METALIIIDVQNSIVSNEISPICDLDCILGNIEFLLQKARTAQVPVFFIQHTSTTREGFIEGSQGWQINDQVKPLKNEFIIKKKVCDSFHETTLSAELKKLRIAHLVIAGFKTEMCIDTACRRAFTLGYKTTLIEDAHSTSDNTVLMAKQIIEHHNLTLAKSFVRLSKTNNITAFN